MDMDLTPRAREVFETGGRRQARALGNVGAIYDTPVMPGDFIGSLKQNASNIVNANEWVPLITLSALVYFIIKR